ncbi:DoxX family protein [Prolixibacteraceae bacterium Z1-6]|uniref:DoxX family protein n=1 Tax=Draconibacterium aestuarii TaxID=2998507 RepID=A0A9X3FE67_9BACT|nr:DoxX family protein [Prolixibacteraceae bacterium Z1-6]
MNIALWILQILLAAFFLTMGSIKAVLPKDKLLKVFEWIDDFSREKIKTIGGFEIAGALGLFIPGVYSLPEIIIPLSAAGLAIIMVLAAITHYNRGEKSDLNLNIVLFILLAIVIVGRLAF